MTKRDAPEAARSGRRAARAAEGGPERPQAIGLAYVADYYRRYPGEDVTLYTRVDVPVGTPAYSLQVALGPGLTPGETTAPDGSVPRAAVEDGTRYLLWQVEKPEAGSCEYRVVATVGPTQQDTTVKSSATVIAGGEEDKARVSETVAIAVSAKGRYLRYLPGLYERDELMGRFLMLFESLLRPIESRADNLAVYADPRMAPEGLLPWLASWFGLVLDERWPEERRRQLIRSAVPLFRQRGTRRELKAFLDLLGENMEIVEHYGKGLRMGPETRLGPNALLGMSGVPHMFLAILHLPASMSRPAQAAAVAERKKAVQAIIEAHKPAHVGFALNVSYDE